VSVMSPGPPAGQAAQKLGGHLAQDDIRSRPVPVKIVSVDETWIWAVKVAHPVF
jgi:hypothetical protein